jgi:ribosomal protein L37AE/L43A
MTEENVCRKCHLEMKFLRDEVVAKTKYKIFKCEKCNVQVARAER